MTEFLHLFTLTTSQVQPTIPSEPTTVTFTQIMLHVKPTLPLVEVYVYTYDWISPPIHTYNIPGAAEHPIAAHNFQSHQSLQQ